MGKGGVCVVFNNVFFFEVEYMVGDFFGKVDFMSYYYLCDFCVI